MLSQTDLLKLIKILKEEYPLAKSKKQKSRILDSYCLNSGNSRKYIIRTIRSSVDPTAKKRRNRKSAYDGEVTEALIKIWELLDYPCGQKLKPILETELDGLVRSGKLTITDETAKKLKKISSATIDRKLKQQKGDPSVWQTKSSSNLQSEAPRPVDLITNVAPISVIC